jgi:hypothetical protein
MAVNPSLRQDHLMAQSRDSLIARRWRLETRIEEVRAALDRTHKTGVPDAVAGAPPGRSNGGAWGTAGCFPARTPAARGPRCRRCVLRSARRPWLGG